MQWVETWINGVSQTWVPRTITYDFNAYLPQAQGAQPGSGEIGMGTLIGSLGVTKTVTLGSAPTKKVQWALGAVVIGMGVAGVL